MAVSSSKPSHSRNRTPSSGSGQDCGLASTGLAPALVGDGDRWTATRWIDGAPFNDVDGAMHGSLGQWLARLHAVPAAALPDWPLGPRLLRHFDDPPDACPADVLGPLADVARSWIPHLRQDTFVHGDWGDSNVLADTTSGEIITIIDLEDCHIGDAAEDFRWQAMQGPASLQLTPMWQAYGDLGSHAGERIAAATTELILDYLGWHSKPEGIAQAQRDCLPTLRAFVDGWLPV